MDGSIEFHGGVQLGLQPLYRLGGNPLPWMEEMLNGLEHTNFFENRATEHSRAATRGTWEEAFEQGPARRGRFPRGRPHSARLL